MSSETQHQSSLNVITSHLNRLIQQTFKLLYGLTIQSVHQIEHSQHHLIP